MRTAVTHRVDFHQPSARDTVTAAPVVRTTCAVVGLGYVGLPTALGLVDAGTTVIGLDVDRRRLERIRQGDVDLPALDRARLRRALENRSLELHHDPAALDGCDSAIVCVPTPVDEHQVPDLTALRSATASVVRHARAGQLVVLTSTSYVGCTRDLVIEPLRKRGLQVGEDVHVAFSPERIDPGVADHRPETTPRIVGGATPACTERAVAVLSATCPSVHEVGSPEIAEMAKLLENTFRAVNIALINEMADIAHHLDVPITEVIDAAATKPYGFMPFRPGPGVGGHCIPCDPHYLLWQMRGVRHPMPVIESAMTQIATRPNRVTERVREILSRRGRPLRGAHVHLVGVAYKPGVADVRESPALDVMDDLMNGGAHVTFDDAMVPDLRVGGLQLRRVPLSSFDHRPDIVVVHTRPTPEVLAQLEPEDVVLDATFELSDMPGREVL